MRVKSAVILILLAVPVTYYRVPPPGRMKHVGGGPPHCPPGHAKHGRC